MRILFTGASSFTGMWFVQSLLEAGHEVAACLRYKAERYEGVRKQRIQQLERRCELHYAAPLGSAAFFDVIKKTPHWDLFCPHGADVNNYKSPDFDPIAALGNNTTQLKAILQSLLERGCHRVLLTGSIFEQNEGHGHDSRALSPYGLSKGLTSDVFRHYTAALGMKLGKFVIPNPFGLYEESRYTTYLIQNWIAEQTPVVKTPDYIRDNIPVTLLAKAYALFADHLTTLPGYEKLQPSFYAESQGDFTARFAREMEQRIELPCPFQHLYSNRFF